MADHLARLHLAFDRAPTSPQSAFAKAKKIERNYSARLRKVARHIGDIVNGFDPNDFAGMVFAEAALNKYADILAPWAEAVANRMLTEVAVRDKQAWQKVSAQMGRALHKEIESAPTGHAMRGLLADQVELITSLPREAAERVHKLAQEGLSNGTRASELAAEIMRTGEVSRARAVCISRTETSRASTTLTQARAEFVGSLGYIFRTSGDSDVRPSHRAMNGKYVAWNDPPTLDGMKGHAGCFPNCRCYCEVVVPE